MLRSNTWPPWKRKRRTQFHSRQRKFRQKELYAALITTTWQISSLERTWKMKRKKPQLFLIQLCRTRTRVSGLASRMVVRPFISRLNRQARQWYALLKCLWRENYSRMQIMRMVSWLANEPLIHSTHLSRIQKIFRPQHSPTSSNRIIQGWILTRLTTRSKVSPRRARSPTMAP